MRAARIAWVTAVSLAALCLPAMAGAEPQPAVASEQQEQGAWAERVQVVYLPDSREVVRRKLRVWDFEPHKNLEFVWEPARGQADGGMTADGTVEGRGKLVWRVRGSASYDPATVYSTYVGALKAGRPDGQGRLVLRSGETQEGQFVAGQLQGQGVLATAEGDRFEGVFIAGKLNGPGRHLRRTGEIFSGRFVAGLRDGEGEVRSVGGATYRTVWSMGRQVGGPAPGTVADGTVGGLLKAQSGSGDADRVEIGVIVEPRMTQQAADNEGMTYKHLVREQDIEIAPAEQDIYDSLLGTVEINADSTSYVDPDKFAYAPAFLEVDLATTDGSRVKIVNLGLDVKTSEANRKPMLSVIEHLGCIGFRPSFSLNNAGWGEARDMTMSLSFSGPGRNGPKSRVFTRSVGTFDQGIDVAIRDVLDEAGVDTAKLDSARYVCTDPASRDACGQEALKDVTLGEIADYIWDDRDFYRVQDEEAGQEPFEPSGDSPPPGQYFTMATGTLDYSWTDDAGVVYRASEPFRAKIPIVYVEYDAVVAEGGGGPGMSPEALRFQDVRFKLGSPAYIKMPVRGSRSISNYTGRLKLQTEPNMTSFTQFTVKAEFADGSVRESKPVSFYYMIPRTTRFTPGLLPSPEACYIESGRVGFAEVDPRPVEDSGEEFDEPQ